MVDTLIGLLVIGRAADQDRRAPLMSLTLL